MLFTDNAAPPLVSESSFDIVIESIPSFSLKSLATFTASWPTIESITSIISCGLIAFFRSTSSAIKASSICRRPAVSISTTLHSLDVAAFIPFLAISTTFLLFSSL